MRGGKSLWELFSLEDERRDEAARRRSQHCEVDGRNFGVGFENGRGICDESGSGVVDGEIRVLDEAIKASGGEIGVNGDEVRVLDEEIKGSGGEIRVTGGDIRVSRDGIGVSSGENRVSANRIGVSSCGIRVSGDDIRVFGDRIGAACGENGVRCDEVRVSSGEIGISGIENGVKGDGIRVYGGENGVRGDGDRVYGGRTGVQVDGVGVYGVKVVGVQGEAVRVCGNGIKDFEDEFVIGAGNVNGYRYSEAATMMKKTTMKEFIDREASSSLKSKKSGRRDFKEIAGSFWIAASVFSRKLQKWKRKQRSKKTSGAFGAVGGKDLAGMGLKGRWLRDTQSEAGECWFGARRSTDTDPRCSIDLARASVDGGRFWADLFGRKSCDTDSRFSIDLGRTSVDSGRPSFRESSRFSIDPGRSSFDRGRLSFREAARFTVDSGRPSFDGGRTASFREAAAAFPVDPGRVSLDRGRVSFREGAQFPIDPARSSFDGGRTASFRESTAAGFLLDPGRASFDAGGGRSSYREITGVEPGRASYDGGRTSFREATRCTLDRGKAPMGHSYLDREQSVLDRNWSARYPHNHLETGVLRLNLPPLKAYKRNNVEKSRFNRSNSMARTILKLY